MIVLIDNGGESAHTLRALVQSLGKEARVLPNTVAVQDAAALRPTHIILTPGPGLPADAGCSLPLAAALGTELPVLGIGLGFLAVGEAFGAKTVPAPAPLVGQQEEVRLNGACPLFRALPASVPVGVRRAFTLEAASLPPSLLPAAITAAGELMAVMHASLPVYGVQFYPHSVLTPNGREMLDRFLHISYY